MERRASARCSRWAAPSPLRRPATARPEPPTSVLGVGAATAGALLVVDAFKNSAEGKVHAEALSELGESLNVEVAPQVIALEDETIELRGDTGDQFRQWREFLQRIHAEEATPQTKP